MRYNIHTYVVHMSESDSGGPGGERREKVKDEKTIFKVGAA